MKYYKPVGVCIYCGSTEDLRKEHIIPLALNGDWILPESSCRKCADITSTFERKILRGPLWLPRTAMKLKTRRPKDRPTSFPLEITKGKIKEMQNVPVESNLPSVVLPIFNTPGFLREEKSEKGVDVKGFYVGHIQRKPENVIEKLKVDKIALEFSYPVVEFARLIGKIGYGYAVGELGFENVINPLILPSIRGLSQDIGRWVGTSNEAALPPNNSLHVAKIFNQHNMIAVAVSLFSLQPAPIYLVLISKGQ